MNEPPSPDPSHDSPPRRITSDQLFQGAREVRVTHAGAVYRLTLTRQGKLILTK